MQQTGLRSLGNSKARNRKEQGGFRSVPGYPAGKANSCKPLEDEMTREILIALLAFISAGALVLAVGSAIVGWIQR